MTETLYYYEVKHMGRWSARSAYLKPSIPKHLKVYATEPKVVKEEHHDKTLDELIAIYGVNVTRPALFKTTRGSTNGSDQNAEDQVPPDQDQG